MIEVGDHVLVGSGQIHWIIQRIDSRIDPLGVLLKSGMTERRRYENFESLTLYQKGAA